MRYSTTRDRSRTASLLLGAGGSAYARDPLLLPELRENPTVMNAADRLLNQGRHAPAPPNSTQTTSQHSGSPSLKRRDTGNPHSPTAKSSQSAPSALSHDLDAPAASAPSRLSRLLGRTKAALKGGGGASSRNKSVASHSATEYRSFEHYRPHVTPPGDMAKKLTAGSHESVSSNSTTATFSQGCGGRGPSFSDEFPHVAAAARVVGSDSSFPRPTSPPGPGPLTYSSDENSPSQGGEGQVLTDLFRLLDSSDPAVREKALSTVFSLVQASHTTRDRILEAGGVQPILKEIQKEGPADLGTARALFHLTTGTPKPPFRLVQHTLPTIQRLLMASDDVEILVIVCYILDEFTREETLGSPAFISQVLPSPFHSKLTSILFHESVDVRYRALKLLSQIASADRISNGEDVESQFDASVWVQLLAGLRESLHQPELQQVTLDVIQHLMVLRLDKIISSKGLTKEYFSLVGERIGFESEIIRSFCAAARKADEQQLEYLRHCGCAGIVERCIEDLRTLRGYQNELTVLREALARPGPGRDTD